MAGVDCVPAPICAKSLSPKQAMPAGSGEVGAGVFGAQAFEDAAIVGAMAIVSANALGRVHLAAFREFRD